MLRLAAEEFIAASLRPKVGVSLEFLGRTQHLAAWADVVQKARRLILNRQVTIKYNQPTLVAGHVIGDHGEYDCEISRHDPASSVIEQWNCQCPWAQYAFGRTRKWKKFEGRVCSHVLALYWRGKSTPLDTGSHEDGPVAPFQRVKPLDESEQFDETGGQLPITEQQADTGDLPQTFTPDDAAPITDLPAQRQQVQQQTQGQPVPNKSPIPAPPQVPQPPAQTGPQYEHLRLFDVTAPPGYAPVAPVNPVSIPGGRPPGPTNPIGIPGALSSVQHIPIYSLRTSKFIYATNEFEQWVDATMRTGAEPVIQLRHPQVLEQRGGKIPMPGAQPVETNPEGVEKFNYLDLGWHPELKRRVNADEFPNGAPEQRGVYSEAAAGRRGTVVGIEPLLKMVRIHIPLRQSGKLMPHFLEGWVGYDDVVPIPDGPEPFKVGNIAGPTRP